MKRREILDALRLRCEDTTAHALDLFEIVESGKGAIGERFMREGPEALSGL
jgi:hypothetical protein